MTPEQPDPQDYLGKKVFAEFTTPEQPKEDKQDWKEIAKENPYTTAPYKSGWNEAASYMFFKYVQPLQQSNEFWEKEAKDNYLINEALKAENERLNELIRMMHYHAVSDLTIEKRKLLWQQFKQQNNLP